MSDAVAGAGDARPAGLSERLETRFPWLADFLAARDWGPLRLAVTEPDASSRGRMVLLLVFASPTADYETFIYSDKDAAIAYERIVEYLKKHGYDRAEYFEQGIFEIVYGGFRRRMDDLKRELGIINKLVNRRYDNRRRLGDAANMANIEDQLIRADRALRALPTDEREREIRRLEQLAAGEVVSPAPEPARPVPRAPALPPVVSITAQEVADLDNARRLARLRLLYQRKLAAIELPPGGFTTKKQADLANQLSETYARLHKLEVELGVTPLTEKDVRVTKGATLRTAYRSAHPKPGTAPSRQRGTPLAAANLHS